MVRFIRGTVAKGKDLMIACEGREGSGKSTTAGNLAKAINPAWDQRTDTIKDLDHLLQVLYECRMGQLYVLDESINIFHNQDWATWEAKGLSKVIRQMRIMRGCWVLAQPDFEGLHPYVRESRIPLRIYHPPVYDSDGMGNGPAQVFWKHEWFSYKEQRVVHRWQCIINDLWIPSLDGTEEWQGYEQNKVDNFRDLVATMVKRRSAEHAKANGQAKRKARKAAASPTPPLLRRGDTLNEVAA